MNAAQALKYSDLIFIGVINLRCTESLILRTILFGACLSENFRLLTTFLNKAPPEELDYATKLAVERSETDERCRFLEKIY